MEEFVRHEEAKAGGSGARDEARGGQARRSDGVRQVRARDRAVAQPTQDAREPERPAEERLGGEGEADDGDDAPGAREEEQRRAEDDEQDAAAGGQHEAEATGEQLVHAGAGVEQHVGSAGG